REPDCALRRYDHLLGKAAESKHGDQPVAGRPTADIRACGYKFTRDLAARRERPLGLQLIFVLDDQHVRKVDRAGPNAHQQLAGPRVWLRYILDPKALRTAGLKREKRFHCRSSFPR